MVIIEDFSDKLHLKRFIESSVEHLCALPVGLVSETAFE